MMSAPWRASSPVTAATMPTVSEQESVRIVLGDSAGLEFEDGILQPEVEVMAIAAPNRKLEAIAGKALDHNGHLRKARSRAVADGEVIEAEVNA